MPTKEATMQYRRFGAPAIAIMIGMFYGVHWIFDHHRPSGASAVMVALLPPLATILLASLIVRYLNADRDEVQMAYRRHAVAWATGGLLAVCLIWNGLGAYKLAPMVAPGIAIPVFLGFLIVAGIALRRRYQ